MSDLISRSQLIMRLSDYALQESPNDNESTGEQRISKMIYDAIQNCISCVEEQPTAYSVDKVVEELEQKKEEVQRMRNTCVALSDLEVCDIENVTYERAIEIVKQGGVGTETGIEAETIRDKAVKWNNHSSKKVPYEFIDYIEGKRTIDVEDDVCEWKSASDGEFIQNPHTKRLYSNEPSMQNVYCNTCGKKIKVGD